MSVEILAFQEEKCESSFCVCIGPCEVPGSACTSASLPSGRVHGLTTVCTGFLHAPGGILTKLCEQEY